MAQSAAALVVERRRRAHRRREVAQELGGRSALRRAMVLMAILGPCRANQPHEGPEMAVPPAR
jgi:hypothetical protein